MSQKVLVAGTGISGIAAARLLLLKGGEVVLYDGNEALDEKAIREKFDEGAKVRVILGELRRTDLLGVELAVISPGIPLDAPFVSVLDEAEVPIWGELQLAYQCAKGKLAAITGTNGKTTTTALTGEILKTFYESVFVVGNIGEPFCLHAMETTEKTATVAEVSSFMLETIMNFRPDVSAILNITPDHLDRHKTMETYVRMKERVFARQGAEDFCILNANDAYCRAMAEKTRAKVFFFSSQGMLDEGIFLEGEDIRVRWNGMDDVLLSVEELQILGVHNHENAMAAAAAGICAGVPLDTIRRILRNFQGVAHRIEYVATVDGVDYYNDSKGTNTDASVRAVLAMKKPIVLIGGGYDKKVSFDEWTKLFPGRVKHLVLIGATAPAIRESAEKYGFTAISDCGTFAEAVDLCREKAEPGDCVLLSPACASWGMFENYEQRGELFKQQIRGYLR